MGIYTSIDFLNANDEAYLKALNGTEAEKEDWEMNEGSLTDIAGAMIWKQNDAVTETEHEYGGWLVDLSKIPENATHVLVSRG